MCENQPPPVLILCGVECKIIFIFNKHIAYTITIYIEHYTHNVDMKMHVIHINNIHMATLSEIYISYIN